MSKHITDEQAERLLARMQVVDPDAYLISSQRGIGLPGYIFSPAAEERFYLEINEADRFAIAWVDALRAEGILPPPTPPEGKVRITLDLEPRLLEYLETAIGSRDARLEAQWAGVSLEWAAVRDDVENQIRAARAPGEEPKGTEEEAG